MDNFCLDVTSEGKDKFAKVFELFGPHKKAIGFRAVDNHLILYWAEAEGVTKFPYAMTLAQAADFAYGWLEGAANYGPQPDHDGDNGMGWRIFCEGWGHVGGQWQAFLAVEPVWAMYGK